MIDVSEEDVEEGGMGAAADKEVDVQEVPSHHVHAEVDSSDDEVRGRGRGRGNPSPSPSPNPNPHPNQEIASSSSVAYGDYLQVRYRADEHGKPERHYLLKGRTAAQLAPQLPPHAATEEDGELTVWATELGLKFELGLELELTLTLTLTLTLALTLTRCGPPSQS